MENPEDQDVHMESAIAIVGMACHLPGARNIEEYWQNLRNGEESIKFFSDEELIDAGELPENLRNPNYVRAQPNLEGYDKFDAGFWGFSPQDAAVTDPAHRLFLEVAYESLEHSGHTGYDEEGTVGVFASSGASLYWMENLRSNPQLIEDMGEFLVRHTGNDMNFLATRLSYELDLRGPSINVQTACSSALVCVHMAAQSLISGECDMAIAGGSTVLLPQKRGYLYRDGEIMSPDGHCRPFDAQSAGTIFGSGAGSIVLRRLEDALADGDTIYGVVRGTAINNDGSQKIGYLAPSVEGQVGAIAEALAISEVDPEDISYIEAHGTGTQVGDPIELEALNQVFKDATDKRNFCRLGSVKSNIGHLGEAAGAAAIIKVCLSLKQKELPPSINFNRPNPRMDLNNSPFVINSQLSQWHSDQPLLAGVTSLGAGGTNAHIILEEAPSPQPADRSAHSHHLITLSAKTETSLDSATRLLAARLKEEALELADVAYTLQVGRRDYPHRRAFAASSTADLITKLEGESKRDCVQAHALESKPSIVYMLPGGGAQYSGMGQDLYREQAVYRDAFDQCMNCLEPAFAEQVKRLVFAPPENQESATETLRTPTLTLTSLFATEYALAKQMQAWGAEPAAMIGHSMGENTAACLSGVMSLQDAMNLVLIRGQCFEKAPEGGMLSISLPLDQARAYMPSTLDVAAVNSPDLCVATGPKADLEALQRSLEKDDVSCSIVRINVAAHSRMLDSVLEEFRAYMQSIDLRAPNIPFTSNLTGTWITDEQAMDPEYWVEHLRNTVCFADNVATVLEAEPRVLVEIGPGTTLTNLAKANVSADVPVVGSMRHPNEEDSDVECALRTLGMLWCVGVDINWSTFWADEFRRRVPLPTYAFERKSYWVEPGVQQAGKSVSQDKLQKLPEIADWFAQLRWHQTPIETYQNTEPKSYLVFARRDNLSDQVLAKLRATASPVTVIYEDHNYIRHDDACLGLSATNPDHFQRLTREVIGDDGTFSHIIYLWSVNRPDVSIPSLAQSKAMMPSNFWGLFNLAKALGEVDQHLDLTVVTDKAHSLAGEPINRFAALAHGPALVIPRELPHISSKLVDVDISEDDKAIIRMSEMVVSESRADDPISQIACRGRKRWVLGVESAPIEKRAFNTDWLAENSSVLISGGMGGIGLTVARLLAEKGARRIVLVGRSALPEKPWQEQLERPGITGSLKFKLKQLLDIEAAGAEVVYLRADVSDMKGLSNALAKQSLSVNEISGVIHAAGAMDDKLLLEKTEEDVESILAPKIEGALVLDALFENVALDFFVVFSSVASYLGLPGQIDYTSANAFLDTFIADRSERRNGRSLVVNWSAWREVGMAAHIGSSDTQTHALEYPALDHYKDLSPDVRIYSKSFSQKDWLISEHKTRDQVYLLPGTGFIELARATLAHFLDVQKLSISHLQFLTAFEVPAANARTLNIKLEKFDSRVGVTFYAEDAELPIATLEGESAALEDRNLKGELERLEEKCSEEEAVNDGFMNQVFMDFGPRWGCIRGIRHCEEEALVDIDLPEQFYADLGQYKLHPAMLDMATGCAQFLSSGFDRERDFYVPISYAAIRVFKAIPNRVFSHIRLAGPSENGFLVFDVCLMDEQGGLVAEFEGFTMKKIEHGFTSSIDPALSMDVVESRLTPEQERLDEIMRAAILPDEGVKAFDRLMSLEADDNQFIVASIDTTVWQKQLAERFGEQHSEGQIQFIHETLHDPDADPDVVRIEAIIRENPGVENVVVRSFLDENERRRFIAFYVPDEWEHLTVTELRNDVSGRIEADLMPQQFVQLDEFACDEQGNIDKSELRDPFAPVDNYIPPHTSTEKRLAKIWGNVVGVPKVGLNENFFDIGGHSLLSIRVIVKVKKEFGVRLDQAKMVLLTLEQMAQDIDQQRSASSNSAKGEPDKQALSTERLPEETENGQVNPGRKKGPLSSFFKKKKN